ncbi:MAG: 3-methyladenine DNA glycosylase Mpg [Lentimonas sp.]|jgi:3-methyladenine DNA glycosylase Mpg
MARVISQAFFDRPTLDVARELLGKQLCRRLDSGKNIRERICETDALALRLEALTASQSTTPRSLTSPNYAAYPHRNHAQVRRGS